MKIKIINSKLANKYFFINAVSGCFDNYRKKIYDDSLILLNISLSPDEKNICENYKNWFLENKKTNRLLLNRLIARFYSESTEEYLWDNIDDITSSEDIKTIKNVFESLDAKFQFFWSKFELNNNSNQKKLEEDLSRVEKKLTEIFESMSVFFKPFHPIEIEELKIFLIYRPQKSQGGKAIDKDVLSIEINIFNRPFDLDNFWLLSVHEAIHANFETSEYKEWLDRFISSKKDPYEIFEKIPPKEVLSEIIVSSFAAGGYLAEKYFGVDIIDNSQRALSNLYLQKKENIVSDINGLRHFSQIVMREKIKEYLENKKLIDKDFLEFLWRIIGDYKKTALSDGFQQDVSKK